MSCIPYGIQGIHFFKGAILKLLISGSSILLKITQELQSAFVYVDYIYQYLPS